MMKCPDASLCRSALRLPCGFAFSSSPFQPEIKGVPFGAQYPKSYRDLLVKSGILNADYTPNEVTAARLGWKLKDKSEVPVSECWWLCDQERQRL